MLQFQLLGQLGKRRAGVIAILARPKITFGLIEGCRQLDAPPLVFFPLHQSSYPSDSTGNIIYKRG